MDLVVLGSGAGGVAEMHESVDDSQVQWGLIRFVLGSGSFTRIKILFLHVNGAADSPVQRGRLNSFNGLVQNALRGNGEESFHASLEVFKKSEVTAANLLERVSKYFVVDGGEVSVDWHVKSYEENLLAVPSASAASDEVKLLVPATPPGDVDRVVHRPGLDATSLFTSGRDALKAVAEPLGSWNWALVHADPELLPLAGGGNGSVDEMRACIEAHDEEVLYGLLRMGFGEGRLRRYFRVFVHSVGIRSPVVRRGRDSARRGEMENALRHFEKWSLAIEVTDPVSFTVEDVIDQIRDAAIVDDDVIDRDEGWKGNFSVEHFREELKREQHTSSAQPSADHDKICSKLSWGAGSSDVSTKTVEETVRLVHAPDGPLNWALFGLKPKQVGDTTALQEADDALLPKSDFVPSGGYLGANDRAHHPEQAPINAE